MAYKAVTEGAWRQVYGALPVAAVEALDRHARARLTSRSRVITQALLEWLRTSEAALEVAEEEGRRWTATGQP